jgi:hypothetical protein
MHTWDTWEVVAGTPGWRIEATVHLRVGVVVGLLYWFCIRSSIWLNHMQLKIIQSHWLLNTVLASRRIPSAGILEQSTGAKKRVGGGLSYRPARLNRFTELIPGAPLKFKNTVSDISDLFPGQGGRGTRLPQQHCLGRRAGQRRRHCRSCRYRPRRQVHILYTGTLKRQCHEIFVP